MISKTSISNTIAFAGSFVLALGFAGCATAAEPFTLSSSAFKDGGTIDRKYGGNLKTNPNCVGDNISPPLAWSNPPEGTKSFAMIVVDPQGRGGLGVDHWIAYGIPATVSGFAEGETSAPSNMFVGGKGTAGSNVYFGPWAPAGAPHHYNFTLIATDLDPAELPAGLTRDELLGKLAGHTKNATGIVGLYAKP